MDKFEFCIIGAGAVGLAVARSILLSSEVNPEKILIVEAQPSFGHGVSSRSSEVIHAGIYYPPNSLKARLCILGKELLYNYVQAKNVAYRRCGKLIVAQDTQENQLEGLLANARLSGLHDLSLISQLALKRREPEINARSALLSPSTGIIDSHDYMHSLLAEIQTAGAICSFNSRVEKIVSASDGHRVQLSAGDGSSAEATEYSFEVDNVINCAGLNAAAVAQNMVDLDPKLIPRVWLCKGDYFAYHDRNPFKHLIYPVPEPNTVGLGIHSTMDMSNQLRFGPDAYYIDKESYDIDFSKAAGFAASVRRYFPNINPAKLSPAYSGIRPKISGPGDSAQDFVFQTKEHHALKGLINLFGIESPGITASLAIGQHICALLGLKLAN
ncbi:MAG: NAD(P)/FAD-dependent oxidoreductase [Pseudohongiellaceae bacterium]